MAMLTNDAFRAMLSSHAEQSAHADATPEEPEEPEEPQRTAAELWAEAPTQPPVPFDGSHGLGLLSSCGCYGIAAEHVDPDCDLCAQNPHADLWAESDELRERREAQALGIMRQSKTDARRLRGDLVPLSLAKRVLDTAVRLHDLPGQTAACKMVVALAESARIAPNTWQLGLAQEAAALLARLIEPSQRPGSGAPDRKQRRLLLRAAALLHSAGRRCDNCGLPLDCCCFWPLTAGADAAASPGGPTSVLT